MKTLVKIKHNNWNDISLNLYSDIMEIINSDEEELTKEVKIIALLSDETPETIWSLPIQEIASLKNDIGFLYSLDFNKNFSAKKLTIGDRKYELDLNLNKFTYAQYVDFQMLYKQVDKDNKQAQILSIFLIPTGHKYNTGYDIVEEINYIKEHCSIQLYNEIMFFFLKKSASLTTYMKAYSSMTLKLMIMMRKIKLTINKMITPIKVTLGLVFSKK